MPPKKRVRMKSSSQPPSNQKAAKLQSDYDNDDGLLEQPSVTAKSTRLFIGPSLMSELKFLDDGSRKGNAASKRNAKHRIQTAAAAKQKPHLKTEVIILLLLRMQQQLIVIHSCVEKYDNTKK